MKLFVMRHADAGAASKDPKKERERGLTANGIKTAQAIADAMVDADELPKVIFCSPFVRAVETADIVGKTLGIAVNVVGDMAPDRPIEDSILGFMKHDELKRFAIIGHHDNIDPAFNKFGGDMGDCLLKSDKDVDGVECFWPTLVKGEVRRLRIHREFGFWQCQWRLLPSDVGMKDELE